MLIETYHPQYLDAIVDLSLRAWTPVFDSMRKIIDTDIFRAFYDDDWQVSQQKAVEDVCVAGDTNVWVAIETGLVVGFIAIKLHSEDSMGEIYMIAVDPDFQGQGIGSSLIEFVLKWMKKAGMSLAMVETGGDPGHGAARKTYENAGFRLFPVARYFKKL